MRYWFCLLVVSSATVADTVGPWDLAELRATHPQVEWLSREGSVHSLLYEGEKFLGKETQVFAFYASPATLGAARSDSKVPGVVLIHGGGGTAFAEWCWLWAQRGYAAIAMDLSGSRPPAPKYDAEGKPIANAHRKEGRTKLTHGGPDHGHEQKFDSIGGDSSDDWPYHAAASVIRAHNVLRSMDEVDAERTAVTGISWGGYTTCLVASLDPRFKAAVPVYGCGFLHEGESVQKGAIDKLGERRKDWVKQYDPSSLLPRASVPLFFVNGTNDVHYPLDSYVKTFAVVKAEKLIRIEVNMAHAHPAGWAPAEIGWFIDSKCKGGAPLPQIEGQPEVNGRKVAAKVKSALPIQDATLHYTVDEGPRAKRQWQNLPLVVEGAEVWGSVPPPNATTWFITVTDERGAMTSSVPIVVGP
jgi:dienelactone hydrolase